MQKELLIKYIEGSCTEQEKIDIVQWIDADSENLKEFLAIRKLYDITLWHSAPESRIEEIPAKPKKITVKQLTLELLKIAAILIIAMIISRYFFSDPETKSPVVMQKLLVPAGQRSQITLEDGSRIWLNAKTTLIFPNHFAGNTREVILDGEGFFEVTPNKEKPFIVKTEKYDLKVWGTTFNLTAYSGRNIFEASLLEGSVEILEPGTLKGILLKPDQRVFLKGNNLVEAPIEHKNHFLWKDGIISFENESFPEMLKKLELCFDLNIEVKNEKVLNYRWTGKFRTKDGVEHILKVLQLSNKFSYTINENKIIIN